MSPLKQNKHNCLIDIYKLIFAFIILYYHNCFIVPHSFAYSIANEGVCFFFIISGYYLHTSCDNFLKSHKDDKHYLINYIWHKLKKLGIPVLIAYIASVLDTICSGEYLSGFMHYLWYIHVMLIVDCIYIVLLKNLKTKTINIIMIVTTIISILLYLILPSIPNEIEALIFMPMGYFISCLDIKKSNNMFKVVFTIILTFLVIILSTNEANDVIKIIYILLILPLLFCLIISFNVKNFKMASVISRFSLVMYVYQSFVRWLGSDFFNRGIPYGNTGTFLFIMITTTLTIVIEHFISARKHTAKA